MVFLTGPRQIGKTTLAQSLLASVLPGVNYFNWDAVAHRKILMTKVFSGEERLDTESRTRVVFDEIHKFPRWKNTLKGLFDLHEPRTHWIVTGSAMLNVYRRGQDSLLGRHFTYHLAPFSVAELMTPGRTSRLPSTWTPSDWPAPNREAADAFHTLFQFGGFPEPLFRTDTGFLTRWRRTRLERLVNQDLATTEILRQLPLVEQLMSLLPARIGAPLSLNSLREDLEVHFATVKHWMALLERVFYGFFVRPYGKRSTRLLKKEAKWYVWDWTEISDPGIRFENLMAVHLRKYVDYMNDTGQGDLALFYVRDKEKREVDFLICEDRKPILLVECKWSDHALSPALQYYAELFKVPHAVQVTQANGDPRIRRQGNCTLSLLPAAGFLSSLI
ncbi:MAG: ATP-binding protein [Deltaproteobacteria bacterium]|nr:ATP-binding protein [Deltaproteobacteria bacterium]